ncbi:MAG: MBL fold metallo-hydrolase [Gammaproteobacteria bacterium]|nr:MBL fold metallo-hydrolase [Gammaproteobacteria bacterium]
MAHAVGGDGQRPRAAHRTSAPGLRGTRRASLPAKRLIELLDLEHLGLQGAISSFLLEVPEPVLVDPGPATCLDALRARLAERGLAISDLRAVFLTHIHLDHAGATGHLAGENDALTVHVHADAAPHIADPERLVRSTRRTFGEEHDRLWGEVQPVPARNIRPWAPGDRAPLRLLRPISTPGHIGHHLAWLHDRDGVLLCGDALGVILDRRAPAHPGARSGRGGLAGDARAGADLRSRPLRGGPLRHLRRFRRPAQRAERRAGGAGRAGAGQPGDGRHAARRGVREGDEGTAGGRDRAGESPALLRCIQRGQRLGRNAAVPEAPRLTLRRSSLSFAVDNAEARIARSLHLRRQAPQGYETGRPASSVDRPPGVSCPGVARVFLSHDARRTAGSFEPRRNRP